LLGGNYVFPSRAGDVTMWLSGDACLRIARELYF